MGVEGLGFKALGGLVRDQVSIRQIGDQENNPAGTILKLSCQCSAGGCVGGRGGSGDGLVAEVTIHTDVVVILVSLLVVAISLWMPLRWRPWSVSPLLLPF